MCNFKNIKWWNMAVRLMAALVVLGSCSCAHSKDGDSRNMLIEVWTKQGWPPTNAPAPAGFKVTPEEAYQIVARSKKLSLKHRWICFRDDTHYYIADAFGKSDTAKTALKYGVKVNGDSGAVESP
jgi:hypothetical protein